MAKKIVPDRRVELAGEINARHEACKVAAQASLVQAREAGERLIEARALCARGEWLPWVGAHLSFSARTAQCYMRIAERWDELAEKSATVAHLGLRDALSLLVDDSPDDEAEQPQIAGPAPSRNGRAGEPRAPAPNGEKVSQEELTEHLETVRQLPSETTLGAAPALPPSDDDPIPEPANVFVDGLGLDVPAHLAEVFAGRSLLREINRTARRLQALYRALAEHPSGEVLRQGLRRTESQGEVKYTCTDLDASFKRIRKDLPFVSMCAWCEAKHPGQTAPGCKSCQGRGWMTEWQWGLVPDAERAAVLAHLPEKGASA